MSFALFKVRQRKKRWCRRKTEKRVKARVLQKQSQDEAGALPPALLTGMTSNRRHAGPALRNWLFIINLTVPFVLSLTPLIFPTVPFEGKFFSFYLRFCLLRKTKASLLYLVKSCPTGSNQQGIALFHVTLTSTQYVTFMFLIPSHKVMISFPFDLILLHGSSRSIVLHDYRLKNR